MLGSVKEPNEFQRWIKQPDEIGGMQTQSVYIMVPDADKTYQRALDAKAQIVIPIRDEDYGGRGFACFDLEDISGTSAPTILGRNNPQSFSLMVDYFFYESTNRYNYLRKPK